MKSAYVGVLSIIEKQ